MRITFTIFGGPHDGGCVDFDILPEHKNKLHHAECCGVRYEIGEVDFDAFRGQLMFTGKREEEKPQ